MYCVLPLSVLAVAGDATSSAMGCSSMDLFGGRFGPSDLLRLLCTERIVGREDRSTGASSLPLCSNPLCLAVGTDDGFGVGSCWRNGTVVGAEKDPSELRRPASGDCQARGQPITDTFGTRVRDPTATAQGSGFTKPYAQGGRHVLLDGRHSRKTRAHVHKSPRVAGPPSSSARLSQPSFPREIEDARREVGRRARARQAEGFSPLRPPHGGRSSRSKSRPSSQGIKSKPLGVRCPALEAKRIDATHES